MARWKSAVLIHYAKTAPLKKMSRDYVHGKVQQEHTRLDELAQALEDVERHGAGKPSQLERAEFIADRIKGPMKRMAQEEVATLKKQLLSAPSAFIQNPDRRKTWHRASVDGYLRPPNTWRTLRGWPHGLDAFVRADNLPDAAFPTVLVTQAPTQAAPPSENFAEGSVGVLQILQEMDGRQDVRSHGVKPSWMQDKYREGGLGRSCARYMLDETFMCK